MTIWIALIGGVILGWMIEWIIDWVYWRRGIAGFYANEEELKGQISSVQQQYDEAVAETSSLRSQLASANTDLESSKSALESATASVTALEQQKADAEQRFTEAITETTNLRTQLQDANEALESATVAKAEIERQDVETVAEISGLRSQLESATSDVESSKVALATATAAIAALELQKSSAERQNEETIAEISGLRSQLESAASEVESSKVALATATAAVAALELDKTAAVQRNDETAAEIAGLRGQLENAMTDLTSSNAALANATAALAALEEEKTALAQQLQESQEATKTALQSRRDDLEQIDGIGPIYEQKLFDAGIDTFARLAITPVDQLREIIKPAAFQHINFEAWVQQARNSAEVIIYDALPYRLEEIRGIGPVYAKRLNEQGIMTYHDLAHTPEKRLREIIAPKRGLNIDFADWVRQARAFVALTTSDRPPLPLERIKGIGPVFATRLDLAGIHSYADLANADEENLREIIGRRGMQIANLSRWIAEAKAEIDGEQVSSTASVVEESNGARAPRGGQDETVSA